MEELKNNSDIFDRYTERDFHFKKMNKVKNERKIVNLIYSNGMNYTA
jgi:hypothetical protein